jgi:hypothetical protein
VVEQVSNMDGSGSHSSSPASEEYAWDWIPCSCQAVLQEDETVYFVF